MQVTRLITYTGDEEWIEKTLNNSIQGVLFVTPTRSIQVVTLKEPALKPVVTEFLCPNCDARKPISQVTQIANILLCKLCKGQIEKELQGGTDQ